MPGRSHDRLPPLRSILLAIAAVAIGSNDALTQTRAAVRPRTAGLDSARLARVDRLFEAFVRAGGPGYAVGIIRNGQLIKATGYGLADLETRRPITPTSVFNVASLSKQFTATAIALLIREGSVSLDDEVRRHIPEFPDHPGPVRVKHLVYMTSGLPEYYTLTRANRSWNDYFTVDDAIRTVLAQPRLDFPPGTRWAYSNINYMLLAEIVERVSGKPFALFMRDRVFSPLAMTRTHVNDDLAIVVPDRVQGYNHEAGGGYRKEERRAPHFGGSGVFTTIEDLARWDRSFETHALAGPELTDLLLATMKFEHPKANDAFGLVWGTHRGHRMLWYEGGDSGFSSYMARLPDDRLSVIVLSNLGAGRSADYARQVLDILLDG